MAFFKGLILFLISFNLLGQQNDFLSYFEQAANENKKTLNFEKQEDFSVKAVSFVDDGFPSAAEFYPVGFKAISKSKAKKNGLEGDFKFYTISYFADCAGERKNCIHYSERLFRKASNGSIEILYKDGSWHQLKSSHILNKDIHIVPQENVSALGLQPSQFQALAQNNYSPSDVITNQSLLDKVFKNYRLEVDSPANNRCRKLLMPKAGIISHKKAYEDYMAIVEKFNRKNNADIRVPEFLAPGLKFNSWSDPNLIIRLNFAIEYFKKSKGKVLYCPFGSATRGKAEDSSIHIAKKDQVKTVHFESPYFMGFCKGLPRLERFFNMQQRTYDETEKECVEYIQGHPFLLGDVSETSPLAKLAISFKENGEIECRRDATNISGNVYSDVNNRKNKVEIIRSPTGRFEKVKLNWEQEDSTLQEYEFQFQYNGDKCYLDSIQRAGKVIAFQDYCAMYFRNSEKHSAVERGLSRSTSDYWRLADIDDVLREVSNSSFDFQFSDLLKQRKEEYRNFVKESYPSYYLEKRKELAQITQNEYFGEISSEEYLRLMDEADYFGLARIIAAKQGVSDPKAIAELANHLQVSDNNSLLDINSSLGRDCNMIKRFHSIAQKKSISIPSGKSSQFIAK